MVRRDDRPEAALALLLEGGAMLEKGTSVKTLNFSVLVGH
jgi:hypothetical protein